MERLMQAPPCMTRSRSERDAVRPDGCEFVRQSTILENIGDAIYSLAPDWTVTFFNRQAEVFFDRDRRQVLGRSLWDCFPAARGTELDAALSGTMRDRASRQVALLSPSTGRWADMHVFPLEDGGLAVSWRDVSDQKAQELALQRSLQIQQLLSRELAHRTGNNLQQVSARLLLQARESADSETREILSHLAHSVQCMGVVNRLLELGQEEAAERDLGEYLSGLMQELSRSVMQTHVSFKVVVRRGAPVSTRVAAIVGSIVAELVMNACKHAWPEGAPGCIEVSLAGDGPRFLLDVRDDGRGLSQEALGRPQKGLGLRLIEGQVAALPGVLTAENAPSGGACFRIAWPNASGSR